MYINIYFLHIITNYILPMYLIGFVIFLSEYLNQPYTTHFTTHYTSHYTTHCINVNVKKNVPSENDKLLWSWFTMCKVEAKISLPTFDPIFDW